MPVAETVEPAGATKPAPKVRHKSFTYETRVRHTRGRSGLLFAHGKPPLGVSSPPEFKGEAGRWTPEDLYVAAVDLCTMTTFLAFAERRGIPIVAYESQAAGRLEFVEEGYRFTRVELRPRIVVAGPEALVAAEKAMHDAHEACLIARSMRAEIVVEPRFEAAPAG